ncbi:epidermal growth factor receptor substrate 15-like 1 isoform X3 [Mercenaria mercenaria]|uniref:epidermal growth factor receptor substrate 15-like 1 isoform X3 n=1 Tax=Mercenaria mercenaria TaxID=6596 RepID=UPI00234F7784|nr:epidermal growth factor receptor substrate 15-like 1 isoform X3 [Mercenaria mercenaria]
MASFPPIPQIVGKHGPVYEAYYKQADPNNTGSLGALDAANFMKKSGLKDNVLSQIWDMSDPHGKGYLEKNGFFVALKLIALAQSGQDPSPAKLTVDAPQPNLGPYQLAPEGEAAGAAGVPWALSANEKVKYDQVFDSLHPVNNLLAGDKVKPVLLNSKLPMDILGRIWELSDIDKDGYLDRDEFALAMHLVHKGMAKEPLPPTLPLNLVPPSKRKAAPGGAMPSLPGAVPVLAGLGGPGSGRNTPTGRSDSPSLRSKDVWVVTPAEKSNYDIMFRKADLDMDGFVSGQEIRDIFLQSGLQNNVLAHIWNLCDMKGIGKLNSDQFALAMHLMQQKLKGIDPPPQLTTELIPPSMRMGGAADTAAFGVADGVTSAGPYGHVADFSAIKELDMIQKEIDDIKKEKLKLEADQQQQTADIRICQGEVQMLEKELNSITSTLHQLESQKIEAQKVLDELDEKKLTDSCGLQKKDMKSDLETSVREIKQKCDEEQKQIDALNSQIQNQQKSALEYDEDLNKLRIELGNLREEENKLEQKVETGKTQLEQLAKSHKDVTLQVNQTKTRVQHLQDQYRAVQQGITEFSVPPDPGTFMSTPNSTDDQTSTRATMGSPVSTISDFSMGSAFDEDPFKNKDPFGGGGGQADPFASDDPFKSSDPFKSEGFTSDPFASDDPFKDAFPTSNTTVTSKDDPFSSSDPFGSSFGSSIATSKQLDAFDPFGTSSNKPQKSSGDLFGSDPFAPSPPAKTRSESPRPALPPKQKKAPPPRPAPPKGKSPASSPSKPKKPDPFGAGAFPNDPFGSSDPFSGSSTGTSSAFSDDELAWAFTSSTTPSSAPSKKSSSKSPKAKSRSSSKSKKMTREEQEEADYQYALKLSRGEI